MKQPAKAVKNKCLLQLKLRLIDVQYRDKITYSEQILI